MAFKTCCLPFSFLSPHPQCIVTSQLSESEFVHVGLIVIRSQQGPGKGSPFPKPALYLELAVTDFLD